MKSETVSADYTEYSVVTLYSHSIAVLYSSFSRTLFVVVVVLFDYALLIFSQ